MAEKNESDNFQVKCKHMRVSFVKVFRAEAFRGAKRGPSDGGEKAYSLNVLIPKDTREGKALHDELRDMIDDAMDAKWGRDKPRLKPDKFCLRDGDDEDYDGYEGHWYITARNRNRPKVMDADGVTPLVEEDGRPYSGCYANVWIRVWAQDNEYGKRVNASLEAVQFVRDGEAFSGAAPISDEEFEDERDAGDRRSSDRSSRRSRDDEGEDRSSRRSRRDEDEDDRSSRRSSRDDDDRSSRRSRDEDDDRGSRRRRDDDDGDDRRRDRDDDSQGGRRRI